MKRRFLTLYILAIFFSFVSLPTVAQEKFITIASTTSTVNSGLMDAINPLFEKKTGIKVRMISVGTGQAIRLARDGDVDVLLVHHRPSEDKFVADGHGVKRYDVMYNDFVIVGPEEDPAKIVSVGEARGAMIRIAESKSLFLSRGDDSGTHKRELALWGMAGIDVAGFSGQWYRETGSGMGATLNAAFAMGAYTLADRGTWLSFRNRAGMAVMVEGDPPLHNPYGIMLVNPAKHPHVKAAMGQQYIDWIVSKQGQAAIAAFTVEGQQLFHPNASQTQGS